MFRLVRAPYRISIVGGGTDIIGKGSALSFAINKYTYVTIMDRPDNDVVCVYSEREHVKRASELKHDIVRETLLWFGIGNGVEIHSHSDIPMKGCGLGTSSAFAVALVKAINPTLSQFQAADIAYYIERHMCKKNLGKQDHYAAAIGGFNHFDFDGDRVIVDGLDYLYDNICCISDEFSLHKIGGARTNVDILDSYEITDGDVFDMSSIVFDAYAAILEKRRPNWEALLSRNWELKKRWTFRMSTDNVDNVVGSCAKLCGAGGSGYILSCHKKEYDDVEELKFCEDRNGVSVLYSDTGL